MKVVCPSCSHDNELEYSEHIKCTKCDSPFKGTKFISSSILSDLLGLGLLVGAGAGGYYLAAEDRYPVKVEYAIVEACSSSYSRSMSSLTLANNKKTCVCALEDTMKDISYIRYKIDESAFVESFKKNVKACE